MKKAKGREVYIVADNILTPLGKTTAENFTNLKHGLSAVKLHNNPLLSSTPFFASVFDDGAARSDAGDQYTRFEQLLIASIADAVRTSDIDLTDRRTVLIISSTKGNIGLLEADPKRVDLHQRISMSTSAKLIAAYFGFQNQPVIISNACISGVMAIITGMRLLRAGLYDNAVVAGADVLSKFIVSGFQSFQALSPAVCKPFDKLRNGLNLGEGAATVVLSARQQLDNNLRVKGGSVSNDANHISGPSRTGEELSQAITQALRDASLSPNEIGFISAHGTATIYNDEMEANAITRAGLQHIPLNSLKGYYGHTLGAAGLVESVVSIQSLKEGLVIPTFGFGEKGVSSDVNVCGSLLKARSANFLKTASGFGGCNAAVVIGE